MNCLIMYVILFLCLMVILLNEFKILNKVSIYLVIILYFYIMIKLIFYGVILFYS